MYLFQLGLANRELRKHGSCKKRAVLPSYSSFLQIAVNADIPEGTHATLSNGITTALLNSCLKIILTRILLKRKINLM